MKTWIRVLFFCVGCTAFIGCDRVTKQLAKEHLMYQEPRSYLHDTFRFEYAENTGAALGLGDSLPKVLSFWLLSMVPLAILIVLFVYVVRQLNKLGFLKLFSFCLILAGGLGNIIDRIVYDRHVTDFMNMGVSNIRTGIFNVADICVTAGVIGLFIAYNKKDSGLLKPDLAGEELT
ncbi:signal peptidase II [Mucilaginibacter calamicampi]|uniref:Lipoprotein signal peptidase n=1 Tax=Mucilaginibacter calamicampi TaxID=1302352 RepID=A0ABW2YXX9_9SPHI